MIFHADTLDSIWKNILAASITSTITLALALIIYHFIKHRIASTKLKLFFNWHSAFLLLSIGIGPIAQIYTDPELASACFSYFAQEGSSLTVIRWLASAYILVITFLLGLDVLRTYLAYGRMRSLKRLEDENSTILFTGLKNKLKLKPSTSLYLYHEAGSPFVWGLFNHKIVIPESLSKDCNKEKLKAILSHEASHVKSHDSFWLLISHLAKRILFFHPLIYLFSSKHSLVTEMAADEMAIHKCGIQKNQLLAALIEIAEQHSDQQSIPLHTYASKGFSELSERIRGVMDKRRQKGNKSFPAIIILSLLLCSVIITAQIQVSSATISHSTIENEIACSQIMGSPLFTWEEQ